MLGHTSGQGSGSGRKQCATNVLSEAPLAVKTDNSRRLAIIVGLLSQPYSRPCIGVAPAPVSYVAGCACVVCRVCV